MSCSNNQLTSLDVSKNTALTDLDCYHNQLTNLDVSENTVLKELWCSDNQLTSLDVSKNTALEILDCYANQLTSLDVSQNTALTSLQCGSNQLTSLDISNNTALTYLFCSDNQFTSLDVDQNIDLIRLVCTHNQLTSLDVSNNTKLNYLDCSKNKLAFVDLSNNSALQTFNCSSNIHKIRATAGEFSLSELPKGFDPEKVSNLNGAEYDSASQSFKVIGNSGIITYDYSCGNGKTETFSIRISAVKATAINSTNFPDDNFRSYIIETYDTDKDNILSVDEIEAVSDMIIIDKGIESLAGIEFFTELEVLNCYNNKLTSLDTSKNTALTNLICGKNKLTILDVSNNTVLSYLYCGGNQLTSLDVSKNAGLEFLVCSDNQMTSLDVSNNTALIYLYCSNNKLTSLDLESCNNLRILQCEGNTYNIGNVNGSYPLSKLPEGFDAAKASNWSGADYDSATNSLVNFTSDTVTYDYDCGNGQTARFTLVCGEGSDVEVKDIKITANNVVVTYSDESTKTFALDDVTEALVDIMKSKDIQLVIDFVNCFTAADKDNILTDAQIKAIDYVLAHDLGL